MTVSPATARSPLAAGGGRLAPADGPVIARVGHADPLATLCRLIELAPLEFPGATFDDRMMAFLHIVLRIVPGCSTVSFIAADGDGEWSTNRSIDRMSGTGCDRPGRTDAFSTRSVPDGSALGVLEIEADVPLDLVASTDAALRLLANVLTAMWPNTSIDEAAVPGQGFSARTSP